MMRIFETVRRFALLGVIFAALTATATATPNKVVVFGDSLSDSGNVSLFTGGAIPLSPPYYMGRFSNGPNYADGLAASYGLPLGPSLAGGTNFAWGGARAGSSGIVPSLPSQLLSYFAVTGGSAGGGALYVVFGGGNDLRDALDVAGGGGDPMPIIAGAVDAIAGMLADLAEAGARKLLVPNVPNIGVIPEVTSQEDVFPGLSALATSLSVAFNDALSAALDGFQAVYSDVFLARLDTFSLVNDIVGNPGAYGLTNVTDPCLDTDTLTICSDPDSYLFWDSIHPTTVVHGFLAEAAREAIPEPATLALFAFGLLGVGAVRRRRQG